MGKSIYFQKVYSFLTDGIKFLVIAEKWKSYIFRIQEKLYRFVEELFKKKIIREVESSKMKNSESRLGIPCGPPKVHKTDLSL